MCDNKLSIDDIGNLMFDIPEDIDNIMFDIPEDILLIQLQENISSNASHMMTTEEEEAELELSSDNKPTEEELMMDEEEKHKAENFKEISEADPEPEDSSSLDESNSESVPECYMYSDLGRRIVKLMQNKPDGFVEIISTFIEKMSDMQQDFNMLYEYLHLLFHASTTNCSEVVDLLLEKGADPTLVDDNGKSVLHLMAMNGQVEMAKKCYSKVSANKKLSFINTSTLNGWTPLMSAVDNNQIKFVKWLLSKNALVNFPMNTGWTAMHTASRDNNCEVLRLLMNKGGNKFIKATLLHSCCAVNVEEVTNDVNTHMLLYQY